MTGEGEEGRVRLDKWLWAARFFKTRALATDAINGGHVELNGARPKPARAVAVGDQVTVRRGHTEQVVVVRAISDRRGPAPEAQRLYEETPESVETRTRLAEERRLAAGSAPVPQRRPDKRGRRQIIRFTGKG